MVVHPAFPEMLSKATWPCLQYFAAREAGDKGLGGADPGEAKGPGGRHGGAVQAEQEAEQHSVIMRVAIFTWGIHGGGADPRLLGHQHTSEGWDKAWGLRHPCVGSDAGRGQIGDVINAAGFPLNHFSRKLARAAARDRK